MRAEITVAEFWDLTPHETVLAIEAHSWRFEKLQKINLKLAWDVAMLSRQKRIPSLQSLLSARPARKLKGAELQNRRAEFAAMASPKNIELINLHMRKKAKK